MHLFEANPLRTSFPPKEFRSRNHFGDKIRPGGVIVCVFLKKIQEEQINKKVSQIMKRSEQCKWSVFTDRGPGARSRAPVESRG